MYNLWFGAYVAELLLFNFSLFWGIRRVIAFVTSILIIVSSIWFVAHLGYSYGLIFGLLAVFRVINLSRIIKNRMHSDYMRRVTQKTSMTLFFAHPFLVLFVIGFLNISTNSSISTIIYAQLVFALGLFTITTKNIYKLKFNSPDKFLTDKELPTVTVAIPARNETTDLEECLRSLLANDYPKLEIVVLDDCSQTRTAEIIKGFAHDGVRFIEGLPPVDRWLSKNLAYEQLYEQASGDFILFCGVDTRFGTQAIRSMVNLLHTRNKSMVSVLPTRTNSSPKDVFIQPMRYWWEITLPRRLFNRPPVLSTCWIIARNELKKLGGFAAVSHSILPEGYMAKELVKTDKYSFVRSSNELEVHTAKNFSEQYNSAVRTRYPQIHKRPEIALLLTVINIIFLILPFILLVTGFWIDSINQIVVLSSCVLLVITHVSIVNITDPANSLLALISFPIAAISELVIGYSSMIKYEFMTITWKDRNICIPVMHVIPKLPDMPN